MKAISVPQPEKLEAPPQDVERAKASLPVEQRPGPAPRRDVDSLWNTVRQPNLPGYERNPIQDWNTRERTRGGPGDWDHRVRQWDRRWVQYDQYYRPVICNPYRDVLRVIYIYQGAPRIVVIQPFASISIQVAYGAYNFTALVLNAFGVTVNVAVGSFFGGGYYPGYGLPLPPPPPPVIYYDNVPVVVRYSRAVYQPFLVSRIVDAGDDARYGERRVLLDGVTPVWGAWTETETGQRQFEVHRTQQFPGLDDPQEAPLPGDYPLALANDSPAGFGARTVYSIAAAVAVVSLILGAAGLHIFRRLPGRFH